MSTPNVLPNWWAYTFMFLQVAALVPLTIKHVTQPITVFKEVLADGYDKETDSIRNSRRVKMVVLNGAQAFPMIIMLFLGCVWFAKTRLAGQPALQQELVKLPVYAGLFSDICLYAVQLTMLPRDLLTQPRKWSAGTSGILYGLPGATLLKLVWLFGIGRDVV